MIERTSLPIIDPVADSRLVVYTALFGDHDEFPPPPLSNNPNLDFVCVTDRPDRVNSGWRAVRLVAPGGHPRRLAREVKLSPQDLFPGYEASLWLDAACRLKRPLEGFLSQCSDATPMTVVAHPLRDSLTREAMACWVHSKGEVSKVPLQVAAYLLEGYPDRYAQIASGVLFRRHNDPAVAAMMSLWRSEVHARSERDQLSFGYALWRCPVPCTILEMDISDNNYFHFESHRERGFSRSSAPFIPNL